MAWTDLVNDMADVVVDPDAGVGVSITIKPRVLGAMDFATMAESTVVSSSTTVNAVRGRKSVTVDPVTRAKIVVATYTVATADLVATPDHDDHLTDGSETYFIRRVEPIASGRMIRIECETRTN